MVRLCVKDDRNLIHQNSHPLSQQTTTEAGKKKRKEEEESVGEEKWVKEEAALREKVFSHYDKHLRPSASNLTIIVTSLDLLHLRVVSGAG